jgi:hypothetical protein
VEVISMEQVPTIELRVRDFGERLHAMMILHHAQVERYVLTGVEHALAPIGEQIINEAITLAPQHIHEEVKHALRYGEGGKAIRAAVQPALAPLTGILLAALGEEGSASSLVVSPGRCLPSPSCHTPRDSPGGPRGHPTKGDIATVMAMGAPRANGNLTDPFEG